ncbi:MAG: endonuclease VII domain-containing protein [Actinomadura sp.]
MKLHAEFGSNRAEKSGLAAYCKPCHSSVMAENKVRSHGSVRNYLLKLRYGVTSAEIDEHHARQGGICVICLRNLPDHVDHDHETGLFRGLLCFGCNGGLGQFADDPDRLRQAAGYLDREISHTRVMALEFGTPTFDGFARRRANQVRRSRSDQRETVRHYHLTRRYGIGDADVRRIIEVQRGLCPICCNARGEHVDHCHRTKAVRGILCPACNTGMGQFKDDPIALRRAADYLNGELVRQLVEYDGRTRLSFTIPDVDPALVPASGWEPYRLADGRERKAVLEIRAPWIRTSQRSSPRVTVDQDEVCPCRPMPRDT